MKIAVIDGQGGGIGRAIVARVRQALPDAYILALGTNSLATSAMLKAGATEGATGENAIVYNAGRVDFLLGVTGICLANAILGEISPAMARAAAESGAKKLLIPVSTCGVQVMGVAEKRLSAYIDEMAAVLAAEQSDKGDY